MECDPPVQWLQLCTEHTLGGLSKEEKVEFCRGSMSQARWNHYKRFACTTNRLRVTIRLHQESLSVQQPKHINKKYVAEIRLEEKWKINGNEKKKMASKRLHDSGLRQKHRKKVEEFHERARFQSTKAGIEKCGAILGGEP